MKATITIYVTFLAILLPAVTQANDFRTAVNDTVIIELENGSRIIIYTKSRADLKKLQAYDINEMVKDLNSSLGDNNVDFLELENPDGEKYLVESPTILFGKGEGRGDTVIIDKKSMDNIRIRVGGMELSIDPENFDEDQFDEKMELKKYSYVQEETDRTRHYVNMDIGTNNWLSNGTSPSETNELYAVKPWGSWYIGLNWLNKTWVGGPLYIEWGGGVSWYNWKLEDADVIISKGDDMVEFTAAPVELIGEKSKLTASYINASFVPMLDFGKGAKHVKATTGEGFTFKTSKKSGFRIGAGPYVGYRMSSKSKFVYAEGGDTDSTKDSDHFYLENFRYGIRGQVGFGSFDMFATYDLNEVFVGGRGPNGAKLNAFTIGITL